MLSIASEGNSPYSEGDRHPGEDCEGDGDCKYLLWLTHGGFDNQRVTSVGLIARKDWRISIPERTPKEGSQAAEGRKKERVV